MTWHYMLLVVLIGAFYKSTQKSDHKGIIKPMTYEQYYGEPAEYRLDGEDDE